MDFLIEIVVIAAAAYGVKSYFFTPETLTNKETFSSRGATFVKRLVTEQVMPRRENTSDIATPSPEPLAVEEGANPPAAAVETAAAPKAAKIVTAKTIEQSIAASQSETAAFAVPEDSVLRRHYQQQQAAALSAAVLNEVSAIATVTAEATLPAAPETSSPRLAIPEDSVLKRHFLAGIQNKLELQHPPRPSDAVLKRHHKQLIQSRIDAYLAEAAS